MCKKFRRFESIIGQNRILIRWLYLGKKDLDFEEEIPLDQQVNRASLAKSISKILMLFALNSQYCDPFQRTALESYYTNR